MPSIYFRFDGQDHEIALATDLAPDAIGKLLASMPAVVDIHCAKIAGQHIFWHAPFLADVEKATDILTLPAGTFLYWPERQFLELIYGELQAEKAQVSVLGRLTGDIEWLRRLGRHVVEDHGKEIIRAELIPTDEAMTLAIREPEPASPGLATLRAARKAIWEKEPADVAVLLARSGMMLPYGPLAMAEGELRKLHELLWRLRGGTYYSGTEKSEFAIFLIDAFVARIDGFCGMVGCGVVLEGASNLLKDEPQHQAAILDELVLYTGRAAAWLDLYIPWNSLNDVVLDTLDAQGLRGEPSK
ncbi:hypothetical protein ADU59_13355 [Pararhizobium polonicum]|uniref:Uncharacterized protein n=1 Tax=Pararhizobium polonicum TaxID=1612624 RepID=A0A1C7P514_9HYPH|nr:hypothetical protein [Pararhizobium polonicum]OBZ94804.1 hypothetical protein ADU59_13355 [Pararhizobium polonicum]